MQFNPKFTYRRNEGAGGKNIGTGVIERITNRLSQELLPERRLDAYKRQYCGQLVVAADSTEYLAMSAGRGLLYRGRVATIDDTITRIQEVTPEQIAQAAEFLRGDALSSLTFM